jgi:hypothetical protein
MSMLKEYNYFSGANNHYYNVSFSNDHKVLQSLASVNVIFNIFSPWKVSYFIMPQVISKIMK